jgi:glyceraldehyde 3-phosphate dehydrogenase
MRIGINGFGRIGRLVFRALWGRPGVELVHVNDAVGDAAAAAHLLEFDSVHGRWHRSITAGPEWFAVDSQRVGWSCQSSPADVPWKQAGVQLVLECSGQFKSADALAPYLTQAEVERVLVACPVRGEWQGVAIPNIVFGINHQIYQPQVHHLLTAASCTTNCLAPLVQVVHQNFGIRHGCITTLHDVTNTQVVVDAFNSDLRRARSCMHSLIPTTTGSARAIAMIFPDLEGKLNGHAVRVPLLNASITDAVLELDCEVTAEEVNAAFSDAAAGPLQGILGIESRPLVSVDFINDTRSAIVDMASTMVVNKTQLKVYAWYDNEWGYSCRMADLACHVAGLEQR